MKIHLLKGVTSLAALWIFFLKADISTLHFSSFQTFKKLSSVYATHLASFSCESVLFSLWHLVYPHGVAEGWI